MDWILTDVALYSPAGERLPADCLAVGGGRIDFIGREADPGPRRTVSGSGLHVYPGFGDAHGHIASLGRRLEEVDLSGARTLADALERIRIAASTRPPDSWVLGSGWDESEWPEGRLPCASDLDPAVGGRPAYFPRKDFHSAWVSTNALAVAGITERTADPEGGKILRDGAGRPTGVVVDRAMKLVERRFPPLGNENIERRIRAAEDVLLAAGLTSVHDMGLDAETLEAFRRLDGEGLLRLRVYGALRDDAELWEREMKAPPREGSGRFTARAVKLFADGSLGSMSAALLEPYAGDPGNRGLVTLSKEEMREKLARAIRAGYQPCVHAIGDRANREVLDVLADIASPYRLRPRIEHAQIVHPDDVPRFAAVGAIASMQPVHCVSDRERAEAALGSERSRWCYAWRSFADAGAILAFGSDFPVETYDPRVGLYAAITRRDAQGRPPGGWNPDLCLSLGEALEAYSRGPAVAAFAESERGRIERGMRADFTVFDRELSPESLLAARVEATIVDGNVEHAADPSRWQ